MCLNDLKKNLSLSISLFKSFINVFLLFFQMFTRHILWGVVACSLLYIVQAFYVPGVAPVEFIKGQSVEVKVCIS